MIEEFLKEYHKLKAEYNGLSGKEDDEFWFIFQLENLVERYEKELLIRSMDTKKSD